ncbi:MAG: glycosyltransferase family 4 protein [Roseburia sp.]|nr:glycosyltransferase family 4 protein [Roseburia sp.]
MKIAFDGQPLLGQNKTGIAYNEDGLLKGLLKQYGQDQYAVDIFSFKHANEKRAAVSHYSADLEIHECRWFSGTLFRLFSLIFPIPYCWFFDQKREITHFCNYVIPFGVRGKKVVTIHDLAFREYPETVRMRTMLMLKRNVKRSIKRADAIVADSEFTKQEIIKYYQVAPGKICVVPCGVDTTQYHTEYSTEQVECVKEKYNIEGDYFLYLGTLEPRKNLCGLLRAYKNFYDKRKKTGEDIPRLVLAGGKGWMYDDIFRTADEICLEEYVIFTGYVDEEDKAPLMKGASVFCFPSFYEGFGMPPLEAMACGTPVLTSNNSSLEEITGEAAVQVSPDDVGEMAKAMELLWSDKELCKEFVEKGFERVQKYSWENAVKILYDLYRKLGNE